MLLEGGEVWAEVVQSPSLQTPQATSKYRVLRSHAARGAGMWLDLRSGLLGARAQPAGLGCSWRLDDCLEAPPPTLGTGELGSWQALPDTFWVRLTWERGLEWVGVTHQGLEAALSTWVQP